MAEQQIKLAGSIAGFAFDVTATAANEEQLHVVGTVGDKPCELLLTVSDVAINLSGWLLGKECIVNGSQT